MEPSNPTRVSFSIGRRATPSPPALTGAAAFVIPPASGPTSADAGLSQGRARRVSARPTWLLSPPVGRAYIDARPTLNS